MKSKGKLLKENFITYLVHAKKTNRISYL